MRITVYFIEAGAANTLLIAEGQSFGTQCPIKQGTFVTSARYFSIKDWSCGADVTAKLQSICPSTSTEGCGFQVTNANLGGDPCPNQYKSLQVNYLCK
jgi:hypothetical protein